MLFFFTLSLSPDSDIDKAWRKIRKLFKDDIRMSVWELGSKSKKHYHAIMDIPKSYADNKAKLSKLVAITEIAYGTKYVKILGNKMEMYYAGYMQKEFEQTDFLGTISLSRERMVDCVYGDGYLQRAFKYYQDNKDDVVNGVNNRERYSGTLLAKKIYDYANGNSFKNYLDATYSYSEKYRVDITHPQAIASMCCDMKHMRSKIQK